MKPAEVESLISRLASDEPVTRLKAREALVAEGGHQVTRALLVELTDPRPHVRWEAAKALAEIADPAAAHGFLHALEDEDKDVRWLAAEGLVGLGPIALLTVLSGLTRRAGSYTFRQGARRVLDQLLPQGHGEEIAPVLEALESTAPEVAAPRAAHDALAALKP